MVGARRATIPRSGTPSFPFEARSIESKTEREKGREGGGGGGGGERKTDY